MKKKKIYIAGKVTGEHPIDCTLKFENAKSGIQKLGLQPVNPLEVVGSFKVTWEQAMRKCIKALMECDAIYVLPCAENSKGAGLECSLAATLNIPMYAELENLKKELQ